MEEDFKKEKKAINSINERIVRIGIELQTIASGKLLKKKKYISKKRDKI